MPKTKNPPMVITRRVTKTNSVVFLKSPPPSVGSPSTATFQETVTETSYLPIKGSPDLYKASAPYGKLDHPAPLDSVSTCGPKVHDISPTVASHEAVSLATTPQARVGRGPTKTTVRIVETTTTYQSMAGHATASLASDTTPLVHAAGPATTAADKVAEALPPLEKMPLKPPPAPLLKYFPIEVRPPPSSANPLNGTVPTPPSVPTQAGKVLKDPETAEDVLSQIIAVLHRIYDIPDVPPRNSAIHSYQPIEYRDEPAVDYIEDFHARRLPSATRDAHVQTWLNHMDGVATSTTSPPDISMDNSEDEDSASPCEPTLVATPKFGGVRDLMDQDDPRCYQGGSEPTQTFRRKDILKEGEEREQPDDGIGLESRHETLTLRAWCQGLFKRVDVDAAQLKVAICYIIALHPKIRETLNQRRLLAETVLRGHPIPGFSISPLSCPRRTFLGCLILAGKFHNERVYSNLAWARVVGDDPIDLINAENAIGNALQWRLWVGGFKDRLTRDKYLQRLFAHWHEMAASDESVPQTLAIRLDQHRAACDHEQLQMQSQK